MTRQPFSRRSFLTTSSVAALLGAGALAGCSTSAGGGGGGNGDGSQLILWTWPDGFGEVALDSLTTTFPDLTVRQDIFGGDFKQKLTTTFQAGTGLPNITGIKGEDIAYFKDFAEYFVDLNTLGAADHQATYLDWKWAQATTADGQQLGIPIDIGPTALFYRFDVFEANGLPSEPEALAAAIRTWDDYIALGVELLGKAPDTYLVRNAGGLFDVAWRQSGKAFIDESGTFIGDQDHIRGAWDVAVQAINAGIDGALQSQTTDSAAAVAEGRLPADFGASWHLADLVNDAPETSGKWHVCAHPGEAINLGGSFLGIPAGADNPEQAFEVILALLSPENEAAEFTDKGNFPATPDSYTMDALTGGVEFLGGQVATEVFAAAAETVRPLYENAMDSTVNGPFFAEIELVESSGKDPETAWTDAVAQAQSLAQQNGITV